MKIALDVMGGDNAPDINVDGAKRALQDFPLIEKIYLVGREETVRSSCDRWGLSGPRVEIVPAAAAAAGAIAAAGAAVSFGFPVAAVCRARALPPEIIMISRVQSMLRVIVCRF